MPKKYDEKSPEGFSWEYGRLARKGNKKLPKKRQNDFSKAFDKIAENPNRRDLDIEPMEDTVGFRLRIGEYRALFWIDEESKKIRVTDIGSRGDIYKKVRRKK